MNILKILILIMFVLVVTCPWAAEKPPRAIYDETTNVEHIYKGTCEYLNKTQNCILGYQLPTDTFWMFLYDQGGKIYKIVTTKDGVEKVRWVRGSV